MWDGGGIYKVKAIPKKPTVQAYVEVADLEAKLADPQGTVLFLWQAMPGRR